MKKFETTFCIAAIVLITIFLSCNTAFAQRLKPGPQDLPFFSKVDETDQPYAVYIPQNFNESKKYPLVIFLHGAWSDHRLDLRRDFGQGGMAFVGTKIEILKTYKYLIIL